jgi:hypothetical protein
MRQAKDLAYLAGLIDMRFWVSWQRDSQLQLGATVTKVPEVATFLQQIIGGGTTTTQRNESFRHPCKQHCKHAHQHIDASVGTRFMVTGVRAAIVLLNCEPYLLRWAEYEPMLTSFRDYYDAGKMDARRIRLMVDKMHEEGWEIPEWLQDV